MKKRKLTPIAIIAAVLVLPVGFLVYPSISLRSKLISTVANSKEIRLIEHSSEWESEQYTRGELVYRSVALSGESRDRFLEDSKRLPVAPVPVPNMCKISPHHTIEFLLMDGTISRLVICFECDLIEWDRHGGTRYQPNYSFMKVLRRVVEREGLSVDRDWIEFADRFRESARSDEPK